MSNKTPEELADRVDSIREEIGWWHEPDTFSIINQAAALLRTIEPLQAQVVNAREYFDILSDKLQKIYFNKGDYDSLCAEMAAILIKLADLPTSTDREKLLEALLGEIYNSVPLTIQKDLIIRIKAALKGG